MRNNKSLILTDMTYQTRSSSRIIHDIEAGLNNLGLSFIKVYQLPYESLEKPEEFLRLATEALTFLRTNATILTSVTVHIWISFASLFRGQSRTLVPNVGFVTRVDTQGRKGGSDSTLGLCGCLILLFLGSLLLSVMILGLG